MIKKERTEEGPKFGSLYKEWMPKMPGGYGLIPWDSLNCLSPMQTVVWLKICETASKTASNNIISVGVPWLNRNFKDRSEWKDVINTILDLEDLGYVSCTIYRASMSVQINYEKLTKIMQKIGRERGAGMRVRDLSSDILSLDDGQIGAALIKPEYPINGHDVLKKIIDEICE